MTLTVQPVNPHKIAPWRNWEPFTEQNQQLTKEAVELLNNLVSRVGGMIGPLSADVLQGFTWEEPGRVGYITPNYGQFTFLKAVRDIQLVPITAPAIPATGTDPAIPASLGIVTINPQAMGTMDNMSVGATVPQAGKFTTVQATGAFGCNGAAPQASYPVGGGVSTAPVTNVTPWGFSTATQATDILTKINAIVAALTANGIIV